MRLFLSMTDSRRICLDCACFVLRSDLVAVTTPDDASPESLLQASPGRERQGMARDAGAPALFYDDRWAS
jgi:hypothetical protein